MFHKIIAQNEQMHMDAITWKWQCKASASLLVYKANESLIVYIAGASLFVY